MTLDPLQKLREALITCLDTAGDVAAVTGRVNDNLVAWGFHAGHASPVVSYRVNDLHPFGGTGDQRRASITFRAFAPTEAVANELCGAIERALVYPTMSAAGLDAYRMHSDEGRTTAEYDDDSELYAADFDAVLVIGF